MNTTITIGARTDDSTHGVGDYYNNTVNINSGTPVGNGWYRHSYTYSIGSSASLNLIQIVIGAVNGFAGGTVGALAKFVSILTKFWLKYLP